MDGTYSTTSFYMVFNIIDHIQVQVYSQGKTVCDYTHFREWSNQDGICDYTFLAIHRIAIQFFSVLFKCFQLSSSEHFCTSLANSVYFVVLGIMLLKECT
uniref:Neur_chan_LBD domain-containing protein n=1 Tax=Heterorhabditis bacteriophora TaxID=37862 RepID=A0A1I7XGU7_HETBA